MYIQVGVYLIIYIFVCVNNISESYKKLVTVTVSGGYKGGLRNRVGEEFLILYTILFLLNIFAKYILHIPKIE